MCSDFLLIIGKDGNIYYVNLRGKLEDESIYYFLTVKNMRITCLFSIHFKLVQK